MNQIPNELINEKSLYLKQHAFNPVKWVSWSDAAFEKARNENKLVLVSIGYSSCHWCHVMEHDSFTDNEVASLMNNNFICIKVDREEHPSVDSVYMTAVQMMTGKGGWPLNCFVLHDKRPVYGGTFFPKEQWKNLLLKLAGAYKYDKKQFENYAENISKGIKTASLITINNNALPDVSFITECINKWSRNFDPINGGNSYAPKFPLPVNYSFLLRFAVQTNNNNILKHVHLTLRKMALGGIYDHAGGGFSRYSTDHSWKVPHFEKMLYDNAQLISLYSDAYKQSGETLYKSTVYDTISFLKKEMTSDEGLFYSALDADSDGEEGKFYVWTEEELQLLFDKDYLEFKNHFEINDSGYWEKGNYILLKSESAQAYSETNAKKFDEIKHILLKKRNTRVRPGLDMKSILSWNAMCIKGLCKAYAAFGDIQFWELAEKCIQSIEKLMRKSVNEYYRCYANHTPYLPAAFEDYAHYSEALIAAYEVSFKKEYLNKCELIIEYTLNHFLNPENKMFSSTPFNENHLITPEYDVNDNVIPSANSTMANTLFIAGKLLLKTEYQNLSDQMLKNNIEKAKDYGAGYANWLNLLCNKTMPFYECVIVGNSVNENRTIALKNYIPNVIFAGDSEDNSIPLTKDKNAEKECLFYVCENYTCKEPVNSLSKALSSMRGYEDKH